MTSISIPYDVYGEDYDGTDLASPISFYCLVIASIIEFSQILPGRRLLRMAPVYIQ